MVTWSEFAGAAPEIASEGRRLIEATDDAKVLLATVRGDDLPRIHPITVAIVDERLYAFIIARSPKKLGRRRARRSATRWHTHLDPDSPTEVALAPAAPDCRSRRTSANGSPSAGHSRVDDRLHPVRSSRSSTPCSAPGRTARDLAAVLQHLAGRRAS
jgi:hypothetical protein